MGLLAASDSGASDRPGWRKSVSRHMGGNTDRYLRSIPMYIAPSFTVATLFLAYQMFFRLPGAGKGKYLNSLLELRRVYFPKSLP